MPIGVLGGTFDPPHYGHLVLAEQARDQLQLSRVLWTPAGDPPHKQGRLLSPIEDRIAMVESAIGSNTAFELSRIDIDRAGPHYSLDMVMQIEILYPHDQIFFLIGADSLRDLTNWYRPEELIRRVTLVVMWRGDVSAGDIPDLEQQLPGLNRHIRILDGPQVDVSSEHIRARIRNHRSVRYQLPDEVLAYIQSRHLYSSTSSE